VLREAEVCLVKGMRGRSLFFYDGDLHHGLVLAYSGNILAGVTVAFDTSTQVNQLFEKGKGVTR
jgi:hypothetical protein